MDLELPAKQHVGSEQTQQKGNRQQETGGSYQDLVSAEDKSPREESSSTEAERRVHKGPKDTEKICEES